MGVKWDILGLTALSGALLAAREGVVIGKWGNAQMAACLAELGSSASKVYTIDYINISLKSKNQFMNLCINC